MRTDAKDIPTNSGRTWIKKSCVFGYHALANRISTDNCDKPLKCRLLNSETGY
jgi:hypothetical protein